MAMQSNLPLPDTLANRNMAEFLTEVLTPANGCPLCRAADRDELDLIIHVSADIATQGISPFLATGRMCNYHAAALPKVASCTATARFCRQLLVEELRPARMPGADTGPCPLCEILAARQHDWIHSLDLLLVDEGPRTQYIMGDGMCMPHQRMVPNALPAGHLIDLIHEQSHLQCERLLTGLDLLIEKGYFGVPWDIASTCKRAREKLFGYAGLTNYLSLPDTL